MTAAEISEAVKFAKQWLAGDIADDAIATSDYICRALIALAFEHDHTCRALLAISAEHKAARAVVESAVTWRATPPCDGHGSSTTWVGALLGMERAIDAYRASRERGK